VQDEAPVLAAVRRRHVHGRLRQLAQAREPRELQRVVAVGLALHASPAPALVAAGVHDRDAHAQRGGQVVHPPGGVARLDHQQHGRRVVARVAREQLVQRGGRGLHRLERVVAGGHVHRAADALELAEVQAENRRVSHAILLW